jgi:hypothetical protein
MSLSARAVTNNNKDNNYSSTSSITTASTTIIAATILHVDLGCKFSEQTANLVHEKLSHRYNTIQDLRLCNSGSASFEILISTVNSSSPLSKLPVDLDSICTKMRRGGAFLTTVPVHIVGVVDDSKQSRSYPTAANLSLVCKRPEWYIEK